MTSKFVHVFVSSMMFKETKRPSHKSVKSRFRRLRRRLAWWNNVKMRWIVQRRPISHLFRLDLNFRKWKIVAFSRSSHCDSSSLFEFLNRHLKWFRSDTWFFIDEKEETFDRSTITTTRQSEEHFLKILSTISVHTRESFVELMSQPKVLFSNDG